MNNLYEIFIILQSVGSNGLATEPESVWSNLKVTLRNMTNKISEATKNFFGSQRQKKRKHEVKYIFVIRTNEKLNLLSFVFETICTCLFTVTKCTKIKKTLFYIVNGHKRIR